jgi:cytochrome c peroxidase
MGRVRAPTLRNIELTAPYRHDGSIATREELIEHYAAGGRILQSGPSAGVGRDNPYKSPRVRGFSLSEAEERQLVAFLESLTDRAFVSDPRFADPWGDPQDHPGGDPGQQAVRETFLLLARSVGNRSQASR